MIPRQLVYFRYPDFSSFALSPSSHENTLAITGSAQNITGPTGRNGTSTFIARRQDQVIFSASVMLDFHPSIDGEEAGMTLFLQRTQHFDLGVVALNNSQRIVRLRTTTSPSPGIVELPNDVTSLRLRVRALNASTYEFAFTTAVQNDWYVVGYGAASQVSGGFTGVSAM